MRIKYHMLTPVSHIGETASTGSYFQTVLTSNGRVPVITGNSIRGQIRDNIAAHLLDRLDCRVSKEAFNVLFSGGNINGTMREDVEKAKQVRQHFPGISLLGAGLGDMIMAGKMLCSFAYPVCRETVGITGIASDLSWHNLIDEIEFTRTDDSKNDRLADFLQDAQAETAAKAATQMRFSVQYMAAGTEFVQNIHFLSGVTDLELGAFYAGLQRWFAIPKLGGMAAKGFGLFEAEVDGQTAVKQGEIALAAEAEALIADYERFIEAEGTEYLWLLDSKKERKNGKKTDQPA